MRRIPTLATAQADVPRAEAAWRGDDAASDHLPVLAGLVLGDGSLTRTSSR